MWIPDSEKYYEVWWDSTDPADPGHVYIEYIEEYKKPNVSEAAKLWGILIPPSSNSSTRTFWIKATTTPHPWGYKNDDDANRLNTAEKRNALNMFNLKGNIYNDHFSLTETWPIEANLPIPLFCLLEAAEKSNDENMFVNETLAMVYIGN